MKRAIVVLVMAAAGCGGSKAIPQQLEDPRQMAEVLATLIPIGTDIDTAQTIMEKDGFVCTRQSRGDFGSRKGIDYIYCDRSDGAAIVSRRWQIALIHSDGKVTEYLANTGLIGP